MTLKDNILLSKLKKLLEKYFLPLLFGAVVMNAIFRAYMQFNYTVMSIAFTVYECLLFFIFEQLKKKKVIRFFAYCLIGLLHAYLSYRLLETGWVESGVGFNEWFYLNVNEVGTVVQYTYLLFVGLGFFIISVLYYFTCYRFRIFGVMLVALFPFVIYGKRADTMSTLTITFIMTIFLAMMVHQKHMTDDNKKGDVVINLSYVIGAALFVTFVGAVTMVLPKPSYRSELEEGKGLFQYTMMSNNTSFDTLTDESSPRFGADATGELLFTISSSEDEPIIYIRRQSFDKFVGDKWILNREYKRYQLEDETKDNEVNSPKYLYLMMKELAEKGGYEEFGLTEDLFDNYDEFQETTWLNLSAARYNPNHIPAPLMIRSDTLSYAIKDPHGEVYYSSGGSSGRYGGFGVSYSHYMEDSKYLGYISSLPFTVESFERLLERAYFNGDITPEQYNNLTKLMSIYIDKTGVSEDIEKLAHEITDEYDSDYKKCHAIVEYFENNGYIYDLEYEPDDESIEYFLFESKTGVCTSYATAMVLMARAVGIPCRYVEGFAAFEKNEAGAYVVRDSHAHAFVEAFIPGGGWVTFDPTVGDYRDTSNGENGGGAGKTIKLFVEYLSKIILFLGVLFVLVFIIFFDRIVEFFFRIYLRFVKLQSKKTTLVYKRIVRLLELSTPGRENIKGLSPWEVDRRLKEREADVSAMISLFEASCFGGYEPSSEEFDRAYSDYKYYWKLLLGKKANENKFRRKTAGV